MLCRLETAISELEKKREEGEDGCQIWQSETHSWHARARVVLLLRARMSEVGQGLAAPSKCHVAYI